MTRPTTGAPLKKSIAPSKKRTAAATRSLARMTRALEGRYGVPRRRPNRDLIGGLVATVLSQNTTDTNSAEAFASLRERFSGWEDVEMAGVRSIEAAIRTGGLARTKAGRIKRMLREIRSRENKLDLGALRSLGTESVIEYLLSIDGVGMKTAACVALFDLGRDVMPVDTHVHRVIGRTGVVGNPRSREKTFDELRGLVPEGKSLSLHVNLIRLGRELCRPMEPRCSECPILRECALGSRRAHATRSRSKRRR